MGYMTSRQLTGAAYAGFRIYKAGSAFEAPPSMRANARALNPRTGTVEGQFTVRVVLDDTSNSPQLD